MKSIVMIAYCFPPDGSAGVYRPLRFMRHLSAMGWRTAVVAADLGPYCLTRPDPGLLDLVPSDTEVVRVRGRDLWQTIQDWRARRQQRRSPTGGAATEVGQPIPAAHGVTRTYLRDVVRKAEAWCYHPDTASGWISPAVEATIKLCADRKANVIVATGGPWSSFVVAERASRRTGIPYVLDFRDSWTFSQDSFELSRPAWAVHLDRRTLRRLFERAQSVVLRYQAEAECYWRAYKPALDSSKVHLIPNGYEGTIERFRVPRGDKCTLVYTGTMPQYRYDTLLQAVYQLKQSEPTLADRLRLVFVGDNFERLANDMAKFDLSDMIELRGVVPFAESKRLQASAHALLLLGLKPARGYELSGSKIFNYLQAGRPIVGVLPSDETARILRRVGVSTIGDIESPAAIASVLRQIVKAWNDDTLEFLVPDREACEAYSAKRQTAALVRALEGVPAAEPFIPGSADIPPSLRREIDDGGWVSA